MAISSDVSISVGNWQTAAKISLREVASDYASLEVCNCGLRLIKLLLRGDVHLLTGIAH